MRDFTKQELAKLYPRLQDKVRIVLLNAGSTILSTFDQTLQQQALESLASSGIDIRLNTKVLKVESNSVTFKATNRYVHTVLLLPFLRIMV